MMQVSVDYSMAEFLESLYPLDYPCAYRASSILGIDYKDFKKKLKRLHDSRFKLKMHIDITQIHLRRVFIFSDKTPRFDQAPFLRIKARILPLGSYMVFFIPIKMNPVLFLAKNSIPFREIYVEKTTVAMQPKLTYYRVEKGLHVKEWRKLLLKRIDSVKPINLPPEPRESLALRGLYLRILKEVELNPFLPHHELASKLGVRLRDVEKAIEFFHNRGVFRGVCVRATPWTRFCDLGLVVIVKDLQETRARALLALFREYPLFAGGSLLGDGSVLLSFTMPGSLVSDVEATVHDAVDAFGGTVASKYFLVHLESRKFTIPYIEQEEYNKYKRYWNIILEN